MLNMFYDFLPVVLFFVAFKWYGIYIATAVGILATGLQVLATACFKNRLDKKEMITFIVFMVFGGMTLYFHNPIFVKWKPTIIFWIFSLILLGSHFFGKKPVIQRLMEGVLTGQLKKEVPVIFWKKLSFAWIVFFTVLGAVNLYVAYHFSTNAWVNFKLYGVLGLLILFSVFQAVFFSKYVG